MDYSHFTSGGRPVTSINLLLLISEMEGTYQHLKYMGFEEDMNTIDEMKTVLQTLFQKNQKKKRMRPETRESMEKLFTLWNLQSCKKL